jgi:hypothetical protein
LWNITYRLRPGALRVRYNPITADAIPPTISQILLSVGEPVNVLETSDPNEWVAFTPQISSTTPITMSAIPTALSIEASQLKYLKSTAEIPGAVPRSPGVNSKQQRIESQ